jgi:hypothetical protein
MASVPFVEEAPRHEGANFYYIQEDLIKEYAEKNNWKYIITRPNLIIGASKGRSIGKKVIDFFVSLY